ncbi:hypothetical protein AAL_03186 [Moelleriella libera RCEF 2490]|uniref:Uncharacterized protein n=1 Tax=Moelleriella libera RCEF 2490 TaxID=1081109 RepID=A0A168ECU8_9HYPO|nr:hypothetical protein AAL_03186 [Moelleriella libera RCEF 2490]
MSAATPDKKPMTPSMRDRQARGKNPYKDEEDDWDDDEDEDEDEDDDNDQERRRRQQKRKQKEKLREKEMHLEQGGEEKRPFKPGQMLLSTGTFEAREKRGFALAVLDDPEQLMMYAQSTGDSIPGQRHRFMAMLCGFNDTKTRRPTR